MGSFQRSASELTLSRTGELAAFVGDFSYPHLWTLALAEGSVPAPFYPSAHGEFNPAVSPDGRFIAFGSTVTNRGEVFVRIYPGRGKWQISTEGGETPLWSQDGTELYYRDGERLMLVDVRTNPSFTYSAPRVLFEFPSFNSNENDSDYDVTADGDRFVMLEAVENASLDNASELFLTLNWSEELERLVPTNN